MKRLIAILACALPGLAGAQTLTVSAAASLTDAFKALGTRFEARRPGTAVRFNFAASGVLLQQIAQGAPVDVFASADAETMNRAGEQKLIVTDTRQDIAGNTLVLVTPPAGGPPVAALSDLGRSAVSRIALGKVASVPAGRYTQQALAAAGLWPGLQPKLVYGDNVRQVLDYVARGEADAGFVYRTDAEQANRGGPRVKVVLTVPGHAPITYPAAVVADSRQPSLARDFLAFVTGPEGRALLAEHGFTAP